MATFKKVGYGQVEPNHLSAMRTGEIYAQLGMADSINELQNGQFAKYNYAEGQVDFAGAGEWMLVFNEVKLYEARQTEADYVMTKKNSNGYPRLFKTHEGDIFTTNMIVDGDYEVKDKLAPNENGILAVTEETTGMLWEVVKIYTLADGKDAVKVMRIQ